MDRPETLDYPLASGDTSDLPPLNTGRWVVRRKAVIVAAVRSGRLTIQEACGMYRLSVEEFLAWQRALDAHGVPGLRATRIQIYRDTDGVRSGNG
jgi:hypothetical protein